jgi:hypothetical protein
MTRWAAVVVALCGALLCAGSAAADEAKKVPKETPSFGTLRTAAPDVARNQAEEWLKSVGKTDEATQKAFADLWSSDRTVLDKVTQTICLGSADAKQLLDEARDPKASAPTQVPALIKDKKLPSFFRANLALAYAKALSGKRVYEEALEALETVKPEQVADPGAYLFYRAVAEHSLMKGREAAVSIVRLLDDVSDAPERYKWVSALMAVDMANWREKDLGAIARKMDNVERRLDLSRGGPKTQKLQKEIIARLDELIKEKENQGGGCGS